MSDPYTINPAVDCSDVLCAATDGPDATRRLAAAFAAHLGDGDLIVLTGDLGAGKTCFTQGLGTGLGIDDRITSPTFTLASIYDGRLRLNHLDVYRLDDLGEVLDLDLPELLEDGVTVIEWGEQIAAALPHDHLTIALRYEPVDPLLGPDADPDSDADSGSGADLDERRQLRFELRGSAWVDRGPGLRAALTEWLVPC